MPASTAIDHYENFPVASWLCPAQLRAPIAAIYHFARCADDLADEGTATAQQRLQDLQDYRQELLQVQAWALAKSDSSCTDSLPALNPRWARVFEPLQLALQTHHLPGQLLHDLLDAFVQDVQYSAQGSGYANEAQLLDYCRRSANPIGRLLLHLYGITDPLALQRSDKVCSALQLINFWQDCSVDIPRGRYYLPTDLYQQFGVLQADVQALRQSPAVTALIGHCAASARARMLAGASLVHQIQGRAGWELRLVVQGGLRILDKIESLQFSTFQTRPTLKWWDAPIMLWRALWM
jgi:squalene synthase HpnC